MLGSPTIFKQTVESTRGGFDAIIGLIQGEAAMMQRNRMAASERAAEMAQYAAKAQMDIQKEVAVAQAKDAVAATAPLSNAAVQNQRFQRENQLNNLLSSNADMFRGMGINRIQSEWDPNTQTFFDYYAKPIGEGQFEKVYVDQSRISQLSNIFTEATTVRNELQSVVQAGLSPIQLTVGDATYYGASDINKILEGLDSNDPLIVGQALEEYKANRTKIPSLELVQQAARPQSEAERKETNEFVSAVGRMGTLWNDTLRTGFDSVPTLNDGVVATLSVGQLSSEIKNRIRTLTAKYAGDATQLAKDPAKYQIYIALAEFDKTLDTVINNYTGLDGSRPGNNNDLFLNPTWKPGDAPADVLVHRSQKGQTTGTIPGARRDNTLSATQTSVGLVNNFAR
jgi:hypothetical protein